MSETVSVTCSAPVNIAVIKYWGKRDSKLNLPLNSSLSGTLSQDDLKTVTTVMASKHFKEDEIYLNGKKEDINNPRIQKCLEAIRKRSRDHVDANGQVRIKASEWGAYRVRIVSKNNFPTAAGLASSAAGYAALVVSLARLYNVEGDISEIARQGSGSACRSVYGGWVAWERGTADDGSDSIAVQVAPASHWPDVEVLIAVASARQKSTSSAAGMVNSAQTSQLLKWRASDIVPSRMAAMTSAIKERDFATFADLTMKDSNNFHAVCADTEPPIYYLSDVSHRVIHLVRQFNAQAVAAGRGVQVAYTFDAGPNAVLYVQRGAVAELLALLLRFFPPSAERAADFVNHSHLLSEAQKVGVSSQLEESITIQPTLDGLHSILHTTIGEGPQFLSEKESLISASGSPILQ